MNLREWRKSKGLGQGEIAEKIGIAQNTYSAWENGRNEIPASGQAKLRKMGYAGSWPLEAGKEAPAAGGPAPFVTREEFAEARGAWKAELGMVREALEKMGEAVRELALQLREEQERNRRALGEGSGRPR